MHSVQNGDAGADVVVELDVVLALVGAKEAPDVLDDSSLEGQWEREEQGVERGPVEAFAEVGARRDKNDAGVGGPLCDGDADGGSCLLAGTAAQHVSCADG